jgi:hypothetical protein
VARQQRPADRDLAGRPRHRLALADQPRCQPTDQDLVVRQAVASGDHDAEQLESERPTGPDRRIRRNAERQVRPHDQRTRADDHRHAGSGEERLAEGMVGQGAVRGDVPIDDLAERVGAGDVDALEARDDGALRRAQRRRDDAQSDVAASLGGGLVEGSAQAGESALAAGRRHVLRVRVR